MVLRALRTPLELVRAGHIFYLVYLGVGLALLGIAIPAIQESLLTESARLFTLGKIEADPYKHLSHFIPWFVATIATPVIIALATLPVRMLRTGTKFSLVKLVRATPRAAARAGGGMIAFALHALRLIIPVFLLGFVYIFVAETHSARYANIGAAVALLTLSPWIWKLGGPLLAPIVGVVGEINGRAVIAAAQRRTTGKLRYVWGILLAHGALCIIFLARENLVGIPESLFVRGGLVGVVVWHGLTLLADLLVESPDQLSHQTPPPAPKMG